MKLAGLLAALALSALPACRAGYTTTTTHHVHQPEDHTHRHRDGTVHSHPHSGDHEHARPYEESHEH